MTRSNSHADDLRVSDMQAPYALDLVSLMLDAHRRLLGRPLLDTDMPLEEAARWLYAHAPYCVLAHDTQRDPCFTYANRAAQRCFGYAWDEVVGMPSRLSAEAPDRAERDALLAAVARDGYASGYRGLRIAKNGRRFWIEDVTVWNLVDTHGCYRGQAATYLRTRDVAV